MVYYKGRLQYQKYTMLCIVLIIVRHRDDLNNYLYILAETWLVVLTEAMAIAQWIHW